MVESGRQRLTNKESYEEVEAILRSDPNPTEALLVPFQSLSHKNQKYRFITPYTDPRMPWSLRKSLS